MLFRSAYTFDEKHGFLPDLSEITTSAGSNGVKEIHDRNGRVIGIDDAPLRAGLMRKGATILDPRDPSLGPWHQYVRAYPCVGGGKAYVFYTSSGKGVTFTLLSNGACRVNDGSAALTEFKVWLVKNGKVPEINIIAYETMIDRERATLDRLTAAANDGNKFKIEAAEAQRKRIAAMENTWAKIGANATPVATLSAPAAE